MLTDFELECTNCGKRHFANMTTLGCGDCDSTMNVAYRFATDIGLDTTPLPFRDLNSWSLMSDRKTPVLHLQALGRQLSIMRLYAKLEFQTLTGSFKDRGSSVMMAAAAESGISNVVEDSSGNAGASVAAFAARTGINAHIFAPETAPKPKLMQISIYGATVHTIPGTREQTAQAAIDFYKDQGFVYASHALSPYFLEGTKTFAYEIMYQFNGTLPDHIVFPVGNGSLLLGAFKGLRELKDRGNIKSLPRLHCVQSSGISPIASAINNKTWSISNAGKTLAGGIAVARPARIREIVEAVKHTSGNAVTVDDQSISTLQRIVSSREGIFAEPTSAAAFAGLSQLIQEEVIRPNDSVLVPVTGVGPKDSLPQN